ncbi:MAG: undecaprenyl-diphosphate phosphatase [Clostridia bacterium]|nr:undecaprenyl-diphosphate phosphatase [Clostridia bacterium]
MTTFQAVILGLVQGLAEFLPISSSGHLILTRAFMGISDAAANSGAYLMLDILLHAGTLVAVIVVFWKDWWAILKNPFRSKTLLLLFIASLPALVVALLLDDLVESFFTGWFLGISFLVTALFMLIAEICSRKMQHRAKRQVGFKHAITMGVMQAIALLPGVSRSGSTLLGGVATGLNRKHAAKFAFMMSAPAIVGSLLIEGYGAYKNDLFSSMELIPTVVGMIVAAVSGYLAIRFMLKLISRISLNWFALYVAIVGIIVLLLQMSGFSGLPAFELPAVAAIG